MKVNKIEDFHQFSIANQFIKFTNCFLCLNSKILLDDLWIKDGIIQDSEQLFYVDKCVPDMIIDCQGAILSPGFIDIQINGGYGYDFSDISQELETSLKVVSKKLVKFGVTGFCPTLVVSKKEVYHEILSKTYNLPSENSQNLGFHIEGPFLSDLKSGMHDQKLLKDFGPNPIEALHEIYGNCLENVRYITLAPELLNSNQAIKYLVSRGISVSLGHSAANFDEGVVAIDNGANMLTHIFCSMNPFHHRDPHLVGLLTYDRKIPGSSHVYYGIITDLVHTHPTAIKIAHRANKDGLIIVTDANPAFGLTDGFYHFGSRDIEVINEKSYVKSTNILAGGTTSLDQCMRNFWISAGISRAEAVDSVTRHPAEALKLNHCKGILKPGFDADLVMLSYDSMEVLNTWIAGKLVYLNSKSDIKIISCTNYN